MPRTPAQFQAVRDERRTLLLDTALQVIARMGYSGASVRTIAQEAGIAQGLLYHYFPSKDALLRAILEHGMVDVLDSFAAADSAATPQAAVEQLIRRSFEIIVAHRDFWRLSYSVRMQPDVLASIGDLVNQWSHQIITTLEEHMRALGAPSPTIEAALLFAQIDGVAQHYVLNPEQYPLEAVIDALVARYTQERI